MIPLISIVGRPNVGKSTLFNRLVRKRKSIIFKEPGSTRDLLKDSFEINNKSFVLVDSGGFDNNKKEFNSLIKEKIIEIIKKSNLVLFLLDGKAGLQKEDIEILSIIRKYKKIFIPVVNKIDYKFFEDNFNEFYKLGIDNFIKISAEHDRNIRSITDSISSFFETTDIKITQSEKIKISIIGKPNVGKSTLLNKIGNNNISIVSEIPGTTRDTVDLEIQRKDKIYHFNDTAGLRRKSKINEKVEYYSTSRAISSIESSDIVIFLIDCQTGPTKQDAKILNFAKKKNKAIIIAINKSDLLPNELRNADNLKEKIFEYFPQINYAKILTISALNGKNVNKIFTLIDEIDEKLTKKINVNKLNKFLKLVLENFSVPVNKGRRFKIYYASQTKVQPQEFIIFANFAKNLPISFRKYIERSIRKEFKLDGISFKISYRTSRKE